MERKYNSQLEINDLIDDAVKNAVTRRNEVLDSEEALLSMSEEEAKSVAGGVSALTPTIIGKFPPITTIGLIAQTDTLS
ncbi:hypothetical protein [Nostoc sp.]|uniref:hypothetical protein n=1 Tax=Nostoc sp. TaxID=1180 RepID=UPI002FFBAA52